MANQPLPDPKRLYPSGPDRWVVLCEFAGIDTREWCRCDTHAAAVQAMCDLGALLDTLGDSPTTTWIPPAPIGRVMLATRCADGSPPGTWPLLVFAIPQTVDPVVDDHDHADQVARFGECVTCATRTNVLPSRPLDAATGYVGKQHPPTAHAMEARALPRSGTMRNRLAKAVADAPDGATDYDLEDWGHGAHQSVSGCRNGLVRDGWLTTDGTTRPNRFGNQATVWVATPALRAALGRGS